MSARLLIPVAAMAAFDAVAPGRNRGMRRDVDRIATPVVVAELRRLAAAAATELAWTEAELRQLAKHSPDSDAYHRIDRIDCRYRHLRDVLAARADELETSA